MSGCPGAPNDCGTAFSSRCIFSPSYRTRYSRPAIVIVSDSATRTFVTGCVEKLLVGSSSILAVPEIAMVAPLIDWWSITVMLLDLKTTGDGMMINFAWSTYSELVYALQACI